MKILEEKRGNQQDVYPAKLSRVYINRGGVYLVMLEGEHRYLTIGNKAGDPNAYALYKTALEAIVTGQSNLCIRYWPCKPTPEDKCEHIMGDLTIIEFRQF